MKNYINYINESKDYQEQYDKDTLSYKLQTALDKPGDNDKEIRKLIGSFDDIDYTYDYNRAKWEWKSETDQLTIIFEPEDNEEVEELVGLESGELFTYLYYLNAQGSNEQTDLSEIEYTLNDENGELMKKILKIFNIEYNLYEDETKIRYFFNLFDDYKEIYEIKDNILYDIGDYVYECKVAMANKEYHKLNFFITEGHVNGETYLEFVFDLKKVKNFKVNTLYEYFQLNDNITWDIGGYDEDKDAKESLDKSTKEYLEQLLKIVTEKKDDIIKNMTIKYNIPKIKSLGGDFYDYIKSYDFQKIFINNDANKLKILIDEEIVNDKIMEDFSYLIDINKFDI